jgi:hypothetical protein
MALPRHLSFALLLSLLVFAVAAGVQAQTAPPAAAPSSSPIDSIPPACLPHATSFQISCATELELAQKELNPAALSTAAAADAAIAKYAASGAPPPSTECCKASCSFNTEGCVCSPAVVQAAGEYLVSNSGSGAASAPAAPPSPADTARVLTSIARAFHDACAPTLAYPLYAGDACGTAPAPGSPQAQAAVAKCGGGSR